ncbi:hypothetical protein C8R44DRAFT_308393 [Mycena epipterygia]|nr:hypothetical protein C8R44DRAFT_308393 [Mycena epipterygia]
MVQENPEAFNQAISKDISKPKAETYFTEIVCQFPTFHHAMIFLSSFIATGGHSRANSRHRREV